MPAQLALIICILFVLWLLRIERRQTPDVSLALWIPTIWMLSIASKPMGVWFGSVGDSADGSPLDRVFLSSLLCLGLMMLMVRRFNWSRAIKENVWMILLICYMLVSILWSDIPVISFKRWIRELIAVVMAFLVLTERDPREAMQSLFRRTIYILIPFSILLIKYFPAYGVRYGRWSGGQMWIGVALQKNGLGRLCLIAAFSLIWTLVRRWQESDGPVVKYQTFADVSVLILTLIIIMGPGGAYSATALTSLVGGLTAFIGLLWIKKHRISLGQNTLTMILVLIICLGVVTPFVGGATVSGFTSTLGRDETLTGRAEIWAGLLPVVMRKPIVGNGFGSFWTPENREAHEIGEAHNGYLDELLELGFVGLVLVSMFFLSSCRKAQRELANDFDWASLWICLLLMALIHNITETSLNSFTSQLTAVLLFLSVASTAETSYAEQVSLEVYISKH
jgi:O-antigen ligase